MKTHSTVESYISDFPEEVQKILEKIRVIIKTVAPASVEVISYGIPTFKLNGKNLIHFGGFKDHTSLFPGSEAIEVFAKELTEYKTSKGTIQFPLDKPVPYNLIDRITEFRVKKNE
jgi:uncharacterized protein YdhG (YjbR/CyaY superfamily)